MLKAFSMNWINSVLKLAERERWLVLNKADLLDAEACAQIETDVVAALKWEGRGIPY